MNPAGAPGERWGPPRAEERGRPQRTSRWGWLACLVGACLLVGAVAVEAQVGSIGSTALGVRLPSGANSVTAEPSGPDPETTVALDRVEQSTASSAVTSTSPPAADSIPTSATTAPKKSGTTRVTSPTSVGAPAADVPPPPTQVPTATTSSISPPPTNALSTSTSQLANTTPTTVAIVTTLATVTTTTVTTAATTTTVTTVAPFDPALCANWLYFLLHWTKCRALLPPPSTSTTHPPDD